MSAPSAESLRALRHGDRAEALRACLEALDIEDHELQGAALEVLRALDPQPELSALLGESPRAALQAIMALRDERFGPAVGRLARGSDQPAVRALAVRALSVLATPERGALLRDALRDPAPAVRSYAASALGSRPTPEDLAALREALAREADPTVKVFFVDVLDKHGALP